MKHIKIGAVVLALVFIATSAFTTKKQTFTSSHWYSFTGDANDLDQLLDRANYVYLSSEEKPCTDVEKICAIKYEGTTGTSGAIDVSFDSDGTFQQLIEDVFDGTIPVDNTNRVAERADD